MLTVDDLTGGLDLRRSPTLLASNRARTLKNWSLEEPGALVVRPGYQQVSTASLGSGRAQGGQRVYLSSAVFSLVAWNGAIYNPSDAWVWGSAVYSTLSTANQIFFPYDRELVAVFDGANRPRMSTNGSSWVLMGIDAPSSKATLSSVQSGSGALTTGEYAIVYTYKYRGTAFEGNPSSESTITLTASTANSIHAEASPSTDAKVDAYVWYARHKLPDQESVLRKVSSGPASTVTILSSNWTSNDEAPVNHTPPVAGLRFGVIWKNRWWAPDGTIGNRLRFTELFLSQAWPSNYFIDMPFEKGDSITSVTQLGDTLVVRGQSGAFLVIGQTSLDFEVRPSQGSDTGQLGPRAGAKVEQAEVHVSAEDVASFDSASDRSLAFDIQPAIRDLAEHSAGTDLARIASVYDGLKKELRTAAPRVYPTGERGELVLNLDRTRENEGAPAWTTTDRDVAFYIHWHGNEQTAGNRGRLFSMPSTSGVVFEENIDGVGANSSNLTAEYEGPALSFGLHRTRVLGTWVEYEPHAGAFSIDLLVDGVSQGTRSVDISGGLFPYGSTVTYGTASRTYGGASRKKSQFVTWPQTADGHTAVFKAAYTGKDRFRLFTYAHLILPEPEPRNL